MKDEDQDEAQDSLPAGEQQSEPDPSQGDEIDRLLGDDAYFEQVQKDLEGQSIRTEDDDAAPGKTAPAADGQPAAGTQASPATGDEDPIVETIVHKGKPRLVRKSEQRDLLQKGVVLELTLEQLAPVRALAEDPEFMQLAGRVQRLPDGKKLLVTALRGALESSLPRVDGFSEEDVRDSHKLLRPLLEFEGIIPPATQDAGAREGELDEPTGKAKEVVDAYLTTAMALEETPEDAAATLNFMNNMMIEGERLAKAGELKTEDGQIVPYEVWQRARANINDWRQPRHFLRMFDQMRSLRRQISTVPAGGAPPASGAGGGGTSPAQGAKPRVTVRQTPHFSGSSDRLGGGAAGGGASGEGIRDAWSLNEDEFERTLRAT